MKRLAVRGGAARGRGLHGPARSRSQRGLRPGTRDASPRRHIRCAPANRRCARPHRQRRRLGGGVAASPASCRDLSSRGASLPNAEALLEQACPERRPARRRPRAPPVPRRQSAHWPRTICRARSRSRPKLAGWHRTIRTFRLTRTSSKARPELLQRDWDTGRCGAQSRPRPRLDTRRSTSTAVVPEQPWHVPAAARPLRRGADIFRASVAPSGEWRRPRPTRWSCRMPASATRASASSTWPCPHNCARSRRRKPGALRKRWRKRSAALATRMCCAETRARRSPISTKRLRWPTAPASKATRRYGR